MKKYSLHIPADLSLSSSVRHIAVRIFEEVGFEKRDVSRLKLVFDEIFMNAVKYGSVEGAKIYIGFEYEHEILKVCFEDEGGQEKVTAAELKKIISYQKENTDLTKTSGRGLAQITHQWVDTFDVWDGKRGGLCIAFTKHLPAEESVAASQEHSPSEFVASPPVAAPSAALQTVSLEGEIDNGNIYEKIAPVEAFISAANGGLRLDLQKVSFCNSTFLAKTVSWKQKLQQSGADLMIANLNPEMMEVFELVGLTKLIYVTATEGKKTVESL